MIFKHEPLLRLDIPRLDIEGKRFYQTPLGPLESVTTRLSALSKQGIKQWRKRVGEEEADKITAQAGTRGTIVHEIAEKYLNNENYKKGVMPINLYTFQPFKKILDNFIGTIYAQEYPLYSTLLRTAGTVDLVCDFKGILSVVDFKTSRKVKDADFIISYFWQATSYSMMLKELYDLEVKQIVVLVAPDDETNLQMFIKNPEDYEQQVIDFFR